MSFTLSFSLVSPMYSASSWNRILMKIRLELVVSSSFRWMTDKTSQEMASVNRRCAKNLAAFLNLFVSKRWIVSYVSLNICWNAGINTLLTWHNLWKEIHSQHYVCCLEDTENTTHHHYHIIFPIIIIVILLKYERWNTERKLTWIQMHCRETSTAREGCQGSNQGLDK